MQNEVTGIVLSGGKSRRMGTEKGLVEFQGKSLIEYPVQVLKTICQEVLISTTNSDYSYLGLPLVPDEISDCGPMGGITSCMKLGKGPYFFVVSCDVPFVTAQLLAHLYQRKEDFDAIVPVEPDGRIQPLCALYSQNCLDQFQAALAKENFKMMRLLDCLNVKYVSITPELPFYTPQLFSNVNSPSDLE